MKPRQLLEDVRDWLRAVTFTVGGDPIFSDSVYVVPELPIENLDRYPSICAFVVDLGEVSHKEHPCLITQKFGITVFVENIGSEWGESSLLGGNDVQGSKEIFENIVRKFEDIEGFTTKTVPRGINRVKASPVKGKNFPLIFHVAIFESFVSDF